MLLSLWSENTFGACSCVSLVTQLSNALDPLERGWNRQNTALDFYRKNSCIPIAMVTKVYLSESLEVELWVGLSGRVLTSEQVPWV